MVQVTAAEYGELVGAVQPDIAVCLADEVFADSNDKKMKKSVDVSALFACLHHTQLAVSIRYGGAEALGTSPRAACMQACSRGAQHSAA